MSRTPHKNYNRSFPSSSQAFASSPPSSSFSGVYSNPPSSSKRKAPEIINIPSDDDFPSPSTPSSATQKRKKVANPAIPGSSTQLDIEYDDDAGAHEVIDLSQDDENEYLEHYGYCDTKVVGVRYYQGIATVGEQVLLKREPRNQYDVNAIRVDNVSNIQIGHIPRQLAAKLAPLIDDGTIHPEGVVAGRAGEYDMPLTLNIYASSNPNVRADIKAKIRSHRVPMRQSEEQKRKEHAEREARKEEKKKQKRVKVKISKGGGAPTGEGDEEIEINESGEFVGSFASGVQKPEELPIPSWETLVGVSEAFNPREIGEVVQKFGMGEEDLEKIPSAKQPDRLATKMLPYQLQGLAWLLQKEHPQPPATPGDIVQLWKCTTGRPVRYQNIATMFTISTPPDLASGGILADDMGLGKTLQIIALMVADISREQALVPRPTVGKNSTGGTLIVAPVSVMSNWSGQIAHHVSESTPLKVFTYHGQGRDKVNLADYDVVITTYGTMTNEYNSKKPGLTKKGLHSIKWRRVVLDEAHQIRNPKAKSSLAATNLAAESRWCLTGTPIVNTLKDLYSLVRFLRFSGGLSEFDIFNRVLIRPLNSSLPEANSRLQALMASLCLRRTKEMKFVDLRLPACKEFVHRIKFYPEEQAKYDILDAEAKGLLDRFSRGKAINETGKDDYRFLLEILLRMRQVCDHWTLCGERVQGLLKLAGMSKVVLNAENKRALQDLLQIAIDSQEDCSVCLEALHNPRITICKHVFGLECIEKVIEIQHKCPMCRCELKDAPSSLVEPMVIESEEKEPSDGVDLEKSGSKIEALLQILKATKERDPTNKTIIFSQWTSYLNIIQSHLIANGFKFTRIDGTMNVRRRDEALNALENNPECTIMLASLAVASVGLNLVAANQVILTDSWWAPAIEDQAVDRVHRLGQKRETTVWRLIMEGSIEERVLLVQEKKRQLVSTAFQEKGMARGRRAKEARLADLQTLLS